MVRMSALLLGVFALSAVADELKMKDGRTLEGEILEDDGTIVKLKMKKGILTLKKADIESVTKKLTEEQEYRERLKKLDLGSAAQQLDLGRWAAEHGMKTEALGHFLEAQRLDPKDKGSKEELEKLDYHLVDGNWQDPDTYYPSKGFTKLDGRWLGAKEYAWRSAEKEIDTLEAERVKAKQAFSGSPEIKEIDEKLVEEAKRIEELKKDQKKAEPAVVEAKKKMDAAAKRVDAAAEAMTKASKNAEEDDPTSGPSSEVKAANKRLIEATEAHKKASEAVNAASKKVDTIKSDITNAEVRMKALNKERLRVEATLKPEKLALDKIEKALEEAKVKAAKAKAEWEESKGEEKK